MPTRNILLQTLPMPKLHLYSMIVKVVVESSDQEQLPSMGCLDGIELYYFGHLALAYQASLLSK